MIDRARDSAIKASMNGLMIEATQLDMIQGNLIGFCTSPFVNRLRTDIEGGGGLFYCLETADYMAVSSSLHTTDKHWIITFGGRVGYGPHLSNWIIVPGNHALGTSTFLTMKFEAKKVGEVGEEVATSQPELTPWVSINQIDARAECEAIGARLMTNNEWVALARNAESVGWNWDGAGIAGVGVMSDGHSDNDPVGALAVADIANPCYGTGQLAAVCSNTVWNTQRRTYRLTNGQYVWDMGGNVWEWVNDLSTDAVATLGRGNLLGTNDPDWRPNPLVPANGVLRSGGWGAGANAGAFTLALHIAPTVAWTDRGFRCAR